MKRMWEGLAFCVAGIIVLSIAGDVAERYLGPLMVFILLVLGALLLAKGYIWFARRRRHF